MSALRDAAAAPAADPRLREAARALESMLLRQIVATSGAFKGGDAAGSGVREGMFSEALADAVAKAGGIGLADQVVRSFGGRPEHEPDSEPAPGTTGARGVGPRTHPGLGLGLVHGLGAGATPARPPALLAEPVHGHVTSRFGARTDPFTGAVAEHDGVDVGAPEGTPIRVPAAGVVRAAGPRGGYGNAVEVDHGSGLVTLYGHAAELLVSPGQRVEAGQAIATVGSTGRSTGPHLHFEVRMGGRAVDPGRVLKIYASRADVLGRSTPE